MKQKNNNKNNNDNVNNRRRAATRRIRNTSNNQRSNGITSTTCSHSVNLSSFTKRLISATSDWLLSAGR